MRVLVAIANYGVKNRAHLEKLLEEYRSMPYDVDVVVLSDLPKALGPDVEVAVGLPDKDPWSLPFAHKKIFADRVDDYDVFIYSEDDTLIRQQHIDAFLEVTRVLPADRIAGFLRYEQDGEGRRYCSTIHSSYHWVPGSVESFGPYTFARFTNDHSACYLLTREQLRRAIASGGFLVAPHQGRYDLLCTAATDPYTQCGFVKMICISRIEDFLLHHLPNQYLGRMGLPYDEMRAQISVLHRGLENREDGEELLPSPKGLSTGRWNKMYYEQARQDVLAALPGEMKQVLSVGCGAGATEAALIERGARVVGIPLDAVVAESARMKGVEVTPPQWGRAFDLLNGRRFDGILLVDVLQYLQDPVALLARCARLTGDNGRLVIAVPNFGSLKYRLSRSQDDRKLWRARDSFGELGLHRTTVRVVAGWVRAAGLCRAGLTYGGGARFGWLMKASCGLARPYVSRTIVMTACRGRNDC